VEPTTWPAEPAGPEATGTAVMATVNGRPIYMKDLHALLVEAHGLRIAEMLIADTVVAQEAARRKITLSQEDVAAENDYWLGKISDAFAGELNPDQRERLLDQVLANRGLTRQLWRATLERNARLRRMVAPQVVVTEAMLKAEFARSYGEKVRVSHIQLATYQDAEKVISLLGEGQDFAALARKHSTNTDTARQGGSLPPFTRNNTSVAQAIREAAFALTKPGQISAVVQVGQKFHVLKLHERIPAPTADYEKVKDDLRRELRDRLVERLQLQLLSQLRAQADVEYVDGTLRQAIESRSQP
jgi:foldase protein PrsA